MFIWKAKELIKVHEGYRSHPYRCTSGKLTIGYGRNLEDNGITVEEASIMLKHDVACAVSDLRANIEDFEDLDYARKAALVDLCFNMGINRLLKFRKMLAALKVKDYETAAKELLNSRYAKQVKGRANTIANIIETGILPSYAQ